jgi:hypothetical protein
LDTAKPFIGLVVEHREEGSLERTVSGVSRVSGTARGAFTL